MVKLSVSNGTYVIIKKTKYEYKTVIIYNLKPDLNIKPWM
jgi:hypothetical protein